MADETKSPFEGKSDSELGDELLQRIVDHLGNPPRISEVFNEMKRRQEPQKPADQPKPAA